jgi:tyrosyl-DNA phosphodiesterase 2
MDELVKRSIQQVEERKRHAWPWKFDEPWPQSYHIFSSSDNKWQAFEPGNTSTKPTAEHSSISKIALYSWNIDFMLPFPDARMRAAVRHLEQLVSSHDQETGIVIYLQECVGSDLELLAADEWVQKTFALTDLDKQNWQSGHYGTVTLVDRRLPISSCFRVHYSQTRMERDVLIVDLLLKQKTVRLCNTHLESLALEPPFRPPQMQLTAQYMRESGVHGAAVAGDFNAIQDFDPSLHRDNDLKDAYLELGGNENDALAGHTWGQQAATVQRQRFGTSRMDKVFFCGQLRCTRFERFGANVVLEDEEERKSIIGLGFEKPWITDHLGVMAVFEPDARASSQARM